ncbi:MaoC family dehydratase [Pseudomarimonas salicorniae]|uniref:MaoC family dehydratase n=1 Tax=Pseudomarimonas salicorniae TaxID=2933270 RepID=A0ABT0GEN2_9GAMM|nr:MaoC family dehydratase [Lysobacter sp. CAU 1642]MCK7593005.1 MaoC family dehydratase [Lysobacter sp. CAU 1642]
MAEDRRRVIPLDRLADELGREVACSDWLLVDQPRVDAFADCTEDHQWIHLDADRARRETPFGGTIAHGLLTLSLLPGLMDRCLRIDGAAMTINYGLDRVRFPAPLPAGSRVRARLQLDSLDQIEQGVQARWQVSVERDGSERPVCVALMLARYLRAPSS